MSDASESWSSSSSSYSGGVGVYQPLRPRPANRARRFLRNLFAQFKRMTSSKSSAPANQGWYYLASRDSASDVPLRPLSGILRADTQRRRSVDETGSDEIVQIMNMVIQIPPGAINETVMYETEDPTSSSNDAQGALNMKFEHGSLAAILLSKEPALINLNFPNLKEVIESFSNSTCTEDEDEESSLLEEAAGGSQDFAGNSCFTTQVRGEMRVNKSGRATLSIGSKVFVLAMAAKPKIRQRVVHVDLNNYQTTLGLIKYYIDVLPQEEVETDEIELQ